jgi:arginine/lysine/histidine transporter system substrate-binding protein
MKFSKSLATVALTSVLAMSALVGCGANNNTATNNTTSGGAPATDNEPTLILATSADYKPYEFHDTSSGEDKIVGFDIDIANAIAKQLHFKIQIKDMDFDSLIGALQAKRADFVIAGMTPTEKRKKSVDFSEIYYEARQTIIAKKGSHYTTLDSLKGKKVAAQTGSVQEGIAKKIPNVQLDSLAAIPTIVQEVKTGRADAAIIESTVGQGYVDNNPDLEMNVIPNMESNGSAIAFPKGSTWVSKFNTAIDKLKSDGELDALAKKWFANPSK